VICLLPLRFAMTVILSVTQKSPMLSETTSEIRNPVNPQIKTSASKYCPGEIAVFENCEICAVSCLIRLMISPKFIFGRYFTETGRLNSLCLSDGGKSDQQSAPVANL